MEPVIPAMTPAPGDRLQRFVGDRVAFHLTAGAGRSATQGWRTRLRTNLGRGAALRQEILDAHARGVPPAGASWRDLPMREQVEGWSLELPLTEPGYFRAKAYLLDPRGWQHWPAGADVGISVHPDRYRTGNIIYCAFPRLFGQKPGPEEANAAHMAAVKTLDAEQYTVIPPSGKLRDVTRELPHIFDRLGCRLLHLLPVSPTPTTYARFGRFGSPYATQDLTGIDPALVEFDKRTTGVDQFRELTYGVHRRSGRVLLDIVINHTGWGSVLQEHHPEWFVRQSDGTFVNPGAWGVTWEDLVELKHDNVGLWDELAEVFLTWCRRGVDGFRCDAGYMVPMPAWQFIIARVQQEFPETLFLLEGLGGAWETTEALLTEGGMQWAYSELFQNHSGREVASYLDHSIRQSTRTGLLVHYSETHDNDRLAARGKAWARLRNQLCALTSVSGGFGFTCGVEWLAADKIKVHDRSNLGWGDETNLLPELKALHRLLADHPCFFDGANCERLSSVESPVYVLRRATSDDAVLVLVNMDVAAAQPVIVEVPKHVSIGGDTKEPQPEAGLASWVDLLGQPAPKSKPAGEGRWEFNLPPGAAYCLALTATPRGLGGDNYRAARARAAWGLTALHHEQAIEQIRSQNWRELAAEVDRSPAKFLATISAPNGFPKVTSWTPADRRRITVVPTGDWLLLEDDLPFRAWLRLANGSLPQQVESIAAAGRQVACFCPRELATDATLQVERYGEVERNFEAEIRYVAPEVSDVAHKLRPTDLVLLTNGRGGMARMCMDLGRIQSKYDCVLGANLHPTLPVDRHVLVKRIRVWVNADGFISPLDFTNLVSFEAGPPATWEFAANAGGGRRVEIRMTAKMLEGSNTTVFEFHRAGAEPVGARLPEEADVRLTVRVDIEDRGYHGETKHNGGADYHFASHTHPLPGVADTGPKLADARYEGEGDQYSGFAFTPASDRQLRVTSSSGWYHPAPEWCDNIPHPIEQSRGQPGSGDAYSPGWFELPLAGATSVTLVVTAEPEAARGQDEKLAAVSLKRKEAAGTTRTIDFGQQLLDATRAFVVRRETGKTVIAGYPWFLDWGRDTFICARGLLAGGMVEEVQQMVLIFARFEKTGTLPNTIFGADASNRDTSDAPLWFAVVCEELAERQGSSFYDTAVDESGRRLGDVLESIAKHYAQGTPNGIRMDPASALIWSPSHFTWMDTNYPACTPREGYPVEIQVLWIRLLRQLARVGRAAERPRWAELAAQALGSLEKYFWKENLGYYADVLLADPGRAASEAVVDDALRCNSLFPMSLGLVTGVRAQRGVQAARRYLVVPGALRSLAPLPVSVPLPNRAADGHLLNDPSAPYWGRYEGDEDTRRKPAYHNGTAWTWPFPVFCEAMARAWEFSPPAVTAARAYLASMARLLGEGCLGQLPEIIDGDAPHTQRGCDAQAWGATEALRVWRLLQPARES